MGAGCLHVMADDAMVMRALARTNYRIQNDFGAMCNCASVLHGFG
jgi:hypothetical protein